MAEPTGESTGLVSHRLRRMVEHGFVEEVPELAKGRERWWRAVPGDRCPATGGSRRTAARPPSCARP
ncbi:hypothetical protein [Streptomyces sp. YGL11-2]|uniref:hypothetical protein n=1 Tax=Streptomyces sp. YGL11-2 TaxID=3414028 RepID=UPI003CE92E56